MTPILDTSTPWLVFTDLDGTLLDWRNYSAEVARPALERMRAAGVPVVFCSSKTASEQRALRQSLGLRSVPCIVENGAAIIVPEASGLRIGNWDHAPDERERRVKVLGLRINEVQDRIDRVRRRTGLALRGYRDISDGELVDLTGLSALAAGRARQRDYSETLVDQLPVETWAKLDDEFAAEGLECRHGGRFHTVTGAGTDKGNAVRTLLGLYEAAYGRPVNSVGIGDSANDAPLLAAVGHPYLVAREDGSWADIEVVNVKKMPGKGPAGWVEVTDFLLGA